jgi:hypothetical protein
VATATVHPEFHTHVGNEFDRFVQRRSPELLRTAYLLTGDRGRLYPPFGSATFTVR